MTDRNPLENVPERPLSPHLQIYRPQINSMTSITHRFTGIALVIGSFVFLGWLIALINGPESYAMASAIFTHPVGIFCLIGWSWCFYYQTINGIRHLIWDMGYGFKIRDVIWTGWFVVISSFVLTGASWAYIYVNMGGGI